ncbi:MAG: triose-phosphate isomerase [Parvularculaceae bacterium]
MKPLVVGNWKMNGLAAARAEVETLIKGWAGSAPEACDVVICPPATLLTNFAADFGDEGLEFGGQDCHANADGAHTGDVSAEMLADAGAAFVIVGHSERRADHGESDAMVRAKAEAALRAGLTPIVCVGESAGEREAGRENDVVTRQLDGSLPPAADGAALVVAYEPIWAIGTGLTATVEDIERMHGEIRRHLGPARARTRLLYGGSVKPSNAREILAAADVNGALVGGASLKAADFAAIVDAA